MDIKLKEEMLSKVNVGEVEDIVRRYCDVCNIDLEYHLEKWAENKQHIYKLFGNKLKIETSDLLDMPLDDLQKLTGEFVNKLKGSKDTYLAGLFLDYLNREDIKKNLLGSRAAVKFFNKEFKKGMKISKCFNSLVKEKFLEQLKIDYSMYIQETKSTGTVTISIDPKDYLTMSENNSNWYSCHSLQGEYKAGTLSYMMDTSSTISYVTSMSKPLVESDNYSFANKSWRQIVLIDENNKYGLQLRQYPYDSPINSSSVSKLLLESMEKLNGKEYSYSPLKNNNIFTSLVKNSYDYLYYSDVAYDNFETGTITCEKGIDAKKILDFIRLNYYKPMQVGENVKCIHSGCDSFVDEGDCLLCGYHDDREDDYND